MSHQLVLRRRDGRPLGAQELREHFARPNYEVSKEGRFSASWSHPDTGGSFTFEQDERGDLRFEVPYLRPHVFALEADLELLPLVQRFGLVVDDPQHGQPGDYDSERFISAWSKGNRAAVALFATHPELEGQVPRTLGYELIEATWRWNHGRNALQERLGDHVFVPRIFFFLEQDAVRRLVVWTDAIAMAFPVVDLVLLLRDDFGKQWLKKAEPTAALATWAEVEPFVAKFPRHETPLPWHHFQPENLDEPLVRFFVEREELKVPGPIAPLRAHEVLDEELVATAGQTAS